MSYAEYFVELKVVVREDASVEDVMREAEIVYNSLYCNHDMSSRYVIAFHAKPFQIYVLLVEDAL